MHKISLSRPDDWHVHLRDGSALATTVPHTAKQFGRAIVMPNLLPPVTTVPAALAYRERILQHVPPSRPFTPLMTLYLTEETSPTDIAVASTCPHVAAVKWYPAGATTHSTQGVRDVQQILPVLAKMEAVDLPLLIHGEVTDAHIDIFDRERVFIERILVPLRNQFPALRIVLEHITTQEAVEYVRSAGPRQAATITPHHLQLNRNDLLVGGLKPHHYCLPVLKREHHRQALLAAATGGETQFFLGTDSAPHSQSQKETACGCAGIYSAHAAIECYAEVFATANALDALEGFASQHGPSFYGMSVSSAKITLADKPWRVPTHYPLGTERVIPWRAGEQLRWQLLDG